MTENHLTRTRRTGAWLSASCLVAGCSSTPDRESTDTPPDPPAASQVETQELSFLTESGADRVDARVDVPAGFHDGAANGDHAESGNAWYVVSDDEHAFLGLFAMTSVERDACLRPEDDSTTPGPSVQELVDALVAQSSTRSSEPTTTSLAGYRGTYLEVTGPAELGSCDPGPALSASRGIYGDGQVDQLWIIDVDGQRLVVDASWTPSAASASDIELLHAMVDTVEIVTGAR